MDHWTGSGTLASGLSPRPRACCGSSGIVVNVTGRSGGVIQHADVSAIEVAGVTGEVTIWISDGGWDGKLDQPASWTLIYQQAHPRSWPNHAARRTIPPVVFQLEKPFRVSAGQTVGLYVHTTGWGGMVMRGTGGELWWAETRRGSLPRWPRWPREPTRLYSAEHVTVSAGCSKTWSPAPFGEVRQWALQRHLNGLLMYTPTWLVWSPRHHMRFPTAFRDAAEALRVHLCTAHRGLPRWAVGCVLEFCDPDWFRRPACT